MFLLKSSWLLRILKPKLWKSNLLFFVVKFFQKESTHFEHPRKPFSMNTALYPRKEPNCKKVTSVGPTGFLHNYFEHRICSHTKIALSIPPPPPAPLYLDLRIFWDEAWVPASLVPELVVVLDKLHVGGGHLSRLRGQGSAPRCGGGGVHSAQLTLVQRSWPQQTNIHHQDESFVNWGL